MKVSYQLVITTLVLLLSLQTCQSLYGCGAFERPSSSVIENCILIEEVFESALLNNKNNLHILRDAFLSSSHPSPHLLNIIYLVTMDDHKNETVVVTWTNTKLFTVIDFPILQNLQSGIMTVMFYMEGILFPETILLHLNISGYHFNQNERRYGIIIISQRIIPYAISQAKLNNWNGENKAYALSEYGNIKIWIILALTLMFTVIGMVISWKLVKGLSTLEDEYDADIKRSLFWSTIGVLSVTNFIEIQTHFLLSILIIQFDKMSEQLIRFKTVMIIFLGILGTLLGCCVFDKKKSNSLIEAHTCLGYIAYSWAMCNLFLLAFFVSISIISTTALMAVHPILVLSSISYICMSLFSVIIMFAIPYSDILSEQRQIKNQNYKKQRKCALCSPSIRNGILYAISMVAIHLIFLLYLMILAKVDHTYANYVFQDASSFLPSIILGAMGYFARKKLTAKWKERFSKKELDSDDSGEPEVLQLEEKNKLNVPPLTLAQGDRESATSDKEDEFTKLLPDTQETEL